ncbi:MAG: hypothetical protein ACR2QV_02270, partial [Gammaproteobacteria bacterium]
MAIFGSPAAAKKNNKNEALMCQFSDKFYASVRTLSGDGAIKKRLAAAYADNLELISEDEVPEIIRPRFDLLRRQMHSAMPIGNE